MFPEFSLNAHFWEIIKKLYSVLNFQNWWENRWMIRSWQHDISCFVPRNILETIARGSLISITKYVFFPRLKKMHVKYISGVCACVLGASMYVSTCFFLCVHLYFYICVRASLCVCISYLLFLPVPNWTLWLRCRIIEGKWNE